MKRTAEINFKVTLDGDRMPSKIEWEATDAGEPGLKDCEAILVSLWDGSAKSTLGIDLWTKSMMVEDMNIFVYQSLLKMAETYRNSTNDNESAEVLFNCANEFGGRLNLLKKGK